MNIGAELPFRRSSFSRKTGSLVFDRQRDDAAREDTETPDFRVWTQGRFRKL
ncbi:hypothetical protein HT136_00845 [Novosphingobium profundi]|uniref:hypothetical protein n=1 Tax=Novosphingobium profundi TaxID=1774954 RepID=UPI001BDAA167|nr:hypothetical protein [Novosphingobium profundi]MBT0666916.1 hypothetical protein [Novosphingobium profundi]